MENCIFCKIVRGEVPAEKVYEDADTLAFSDINPKAPGHTLLVTKAHYQWFTDLPEDLYIKFMTTAKTLSQELKTQHGADYIRFSIVGRDVPHVHAHLIPQKFSEAGIGV